MRKKTYLFTDKAVRDLLSYYDELISSCKNEEELEIELSKTLFEFKEFERQVIRGLKDRFYKVYPYDYRSKMEDCLDVKRTKINTICYKK